MFESIFFSKKKNNYSSFLIYNFNDKNNNKT